MKSFKHYSTNESLFNRKEEIDYRVTENGSMEEILSEISERNINSREYLNTKRSINKRTIESVAKKKYFTNGEYTNTQTDNSYLLDNCYVIETQDNTIVINEFYPHNYGDTSNIDPIKGYYITCEGYDNSEDVESIELGIDKYRVSKIFKFNKENMIITKDEFYDIISIIK